MANLVDVKMNVGNFRFDTSSEITRDFGLDSHLATKRDMIFGWVSYKIRRFISSLLGAKWLGLYNDIDLLI